MQRNKNFWDLKITWRHFTQQRFAAWRRAQGLSRNNLAPFLVCAWFSYLAVLGCKSSNPGQDLQTLRIGWQVAVAPQAQIAQVFAHTDILQQNGFAGSLRSFSYGSPEVDAAMAGELDVFFCGDQPTVNLLARGAPWKIIARFARVRGALMVPPGSGIAAIADLRQKRVALPFGSVVHRDLIFAEKAAQLRPGADVTNINLDILEIAALVQRRGVQSWDNIDAIGLWDPSVTLFERAKLARPVQEFPYVNLVVMSEKALAKSSTSGARFLKAAAQAWHYFLLHREEVNSWYRQATGLSFDSDVLRQVNRWDPNDAAETLEQIDLAVSQRERDSIERSKEWACANGLCRRTSDIPDAVDASVWLEARRLLVK